MSSRPTEVLPRPVATGGEGGGGSAPLEKFEPPPLGCSVPFAVTIGIEVYPPPRNSVSPPLLTIPGYGAGSIAYQFSRYPWVEEWRSFTVIYNMSGQILSGDPHATRKSICVSFFEGFICHITFFAKGGYVLLGLSNF